MAVTTASFKARFPEFVNADETFVYACIADAAARCSADAWGANYDQAVNLLAAHIMAISPFGMGLQLTVRREPQRNDTSDNGSTIYEQQYLELMSSNIVGLCVA